MQNTDIQTHIIVAGSGPAGLIAALALAHEGFAVALAGPAPAGTDRRTTALMLPSLALLERLGVAASLAAASAPLEAMRIIDVTGRLIRSPTVTFRAAEIGERHFGLNVANAHMVDVLAKAVAAHPSITWAKSLVANWEISADGVSATLADGARVAARLAVGADGRESPARAAAAIASRRRDLPQAALVFNIGHARPHGNVSTEFHTPTGPFTQVPLPGSASSIVWVLRPETAAGMATLSEEELARLVEQRMESMLGKVSVTDNRQVHRLAEGSAARLGARRVALVGEAAHLIPPIGAQGLNLGCADVEALAGVAACHAADPGSPAAMAEYDRRRRMDVTARSAAVNLLNRSLLSSLLPAQLARAAGLSALGGFAPLRGLFMREGLRPGSGLRALGEGLRKQVGRQ
jgi:2-octaprenyl-6-methoxyphenol hydroxylase